MASEDSPLDEATEARMAAMAEAGEGIDATASLLATYRNTLIREGFAAEAAEQCTTHFSAFVWQSALVKLQANANAALQRIMAGQEAS